MTTVREVIDQISNKHDTDEVWSMVWDKVCEAMSRLDSRTYQNLVEELQEILYWIPRDEAERIVRNMKPYGEYWNYEAIKQLLESKNYHDNVCQWYLVMNMCYNDYYSTAKMYGLQGDVDFYFNLAKNFIEDPDAAPFKVNKYFAQ